MDILKSLFKELSGYKGIEEALKKNIQQNGVEEKCDVMKIKR